MATNKQIPIEFSYAVRGVLTQENELETEPEFTINIGTESKHTQLAIIATIMRNIEINICKQYGIQVDQYDLIRSFIVRETREK